MEIQPSKARKWSREETLGLIDLIEKHPEIWDVSRLEYRDRNTKQRALVEISLTLNIPQEEVTRKWHNLRCQMNTEIRKIKRSIENGEYEYNVHWEYFDKMKFMSNNGSQHSTMTTLDYSNSSSMEPKFFEVYEEDLEESKVDPLAIPALRRKRKKDRTVDNEQLERTVEVVNHNIDEDQVFGDFVASVMRRLQCVRSKNKLRRVIQRAILEAEEEEERTLSNTSYIIESDM